MKNTLSILFIGTIMAFAAVPAHADKTNDANDRLLAAQRKEVTEIVKTDEGCQMMCDEMMKTPKAKKMITETVMKDPECMKMMHHGMKMK